MGENIQNEQLRDIVTPHAHDVLSGRGNFVNHHVGNESFRSLVNRHKKAYVACPKAQKPNFSKLIYDEIRSKNPPGRFLKQDPKTKLWNDIGEKKALDKTRQALREGAPELMKELENENGEYADGDQFGGDIVAPLRPPRQHHNNILGESFLGGASIDSFSLGSLDVSDHFQSLNNQTLSSQMADITSGVNNAFLTQNGASAILAAAAQLQNAQQSQSNSFPLTDAQMASLGLNEAQIQILKSNLHFPSHTSNNNTNFNSNILGNHNDNSFNSFGGCSGRGGTSLNNQYGQNNFGMGSNNSHDNYNDYQSLLALAQSQSGNNNMKLGGDECSALLAAFHNSAASPNSSFSNLQQNLSNFNSNMGGGNNDAYLQLAQQLVAHQNLSGGNFNNIKMNDLSQGFNSSNFNGPNFAQSANSRNNGENRLNFHNNNNFNFQGSNSANTNHYPSGFHENPFNMSVPLKSPASTQSQAYRQQSENTITTTIPLKSDGRARSPSSTQSQAYRQQSENTITTTIPLKSDGQSSNDTNTPLPSKRNMRGGLNGSMTRRGLVNMGSSVSRRSNRQLNLNSDIASSLKSIESLTLDDIDASAADPARAFKNSGDSLANMSLSLAEFNESGMSKMFESESETDIAKEKRQGLKREASVKIHGKGPHDMSELSFL
eukprot:CAMPEP_0171417624 /NCGR_PEP_ID=MMETSP0880-20121228/40694_1 /TAXON_ID=67004 /ORGANISM="Thalassiosira weissflogii, Strain CCMP1336" /LENGTH=660 /DNA_ID=CAMNT_0011935885 /DNA_START=26 /DNA_END=2009 /DNA_ORIENTATION=+